jgi:uncharacterized protein with PIN domain
MAKKKSHEKFVEQVFEAVGNMYEVVGEYIGNKTKIEMKHVICKHEFPMRPNDFLSGRRCPSCGGTMKKTTEKFKGEVFELVENMYEVLGEYENTYTRIKMKHNNTSCSNHEFEMSPNSFLSGVRCPSCAGNIKKTTEQFKDEVKSLVENSYEVIGEYRNSYTRIKMKHNNTSCSNHEFGMSPKNFLRGQRCPRCNESKGEKEISNILDKLNIIYRPQFTFDDCRNIRPLPFDFAIKDNNNDIICLIEYQGEQHYEPIDYFGGEKNLTYVKNNDLIKKDYCLKNNIRLIVIPHWEFNNIENIMITLFNTPTLMAI